MGSARRRQRHAFLLGLQLALLLAFHPTLARTAPGDEVVLLIESQASIYQQAALGFQEGFSGYCPIRRVSMDGVRRDLDVAFDDLRRAPPSLLVTIGTQAARAAKAQLPDAPLLYCLALRPDQINLSGGNAGGIAMDVELSRQLDGIRQAFPKLERLGVVYDELTSGRLIRQARAQLPPGIQLISRAARTPQDADRAAQELIGSVLGGADAFWLLWDPVVANPANFRRLVQLSLTYKVPLIAPARPFVEAGALISVGPNYRKTGEQAGKLARMVLEGKLRLEDLAATAPEQVVITVNAEVARRLGVGFPPDLRREVLAPP
ncbi:MAG: hypothetical protein KIT09_11210 [Bryobacteraceae bacterium]|nr:hypothetical protein [Bryobacteraceae bacterium]